MDVRLLRCFVAVFEERAITAAAQRVFISQPSLSASIKQLESQLGVTLFRRHKRGVDLTDEAHQLYPLALQALGQMEKMSRLFDDASARVPLSLGNFHDVSPSHYARFLRHCTELVPQLSLELLDHEDEQAQARVTLDVFKREDELFLPLWEEDYVLCVPKGHPLAGRGRVSIADLNDFNFIECVACEAHQQTLSLLASEGFAVNLVAKAQHKTQVRHLVSAGVGISFLPWGVLETADDLVQVALDAPRMFRRIGLTLHASDSGKPAQAALLGAAEAWGSQGA
ncbi:LysR family transcriptional regulator [Ferrimonas sp.]|uniref:LysR family transcriptional regulator n=1 Tax=Ferrimonas sp. TaxID=2080861 RepID=UPI003A8D75D3